MASETCTSRDLTGRERGESKQQKVIETSSSLLDSKLLELLLGQSSELLEHLGELHVVFLLALSGLGGNHDHTGRALGSGGSTKLSAGGNKDIRDSVILAKDGNVGDDVHGGDIGGENNNTVGDGDGGIGGRNSRLAESLDDLLNTTFKGLIDGGWKGGC